MAIHKVATPLTQCLTNGGRKNRCSLSTPINNNNNKFLSYLYSKTTSINLSFLLLLTFCLGFSFHARASSVEKNSTQSSQTQAALLSTKNASLKTIAISQIIDHAALDQVRSSLIETLKEQGFESDKNIKILYENAHGNMVTATQIATKLASEELAVAVGISTPSTQTLLQAFQKREKKTPIVFTAVTDPNAAKLTPEMTHYPISGVSDAPNLESLIEDLHQVMPNIKRLGVMYNPAEANSVSTVSHLKKLLKQQNIEMIESVVNSTNDVPQAAQRLIGKVDALYFPQDNTLVAAMQAVINIANQANPELPVILPIYSNDHALLKGVLMANGFDYDDIGKETGLMVAKILKGENVADIPIKSPRFPKTVINATKVLKLGLKLPESLKYSKMEVVKP